MKRLLLIYFLLINSLTAEVLELDLVTFSNIASETNQIDILIDETLKDEKFVFTVSSNKDYLLTAFRKALQLKGLQLVQTEQFFYVEKKEQFLEKKEFRTIKINFAKFEDIKEFLTIYKDIEYKFIPNVKQLLIKSTQKDYETILRTVKLIDKLPKSLKLKISVIETNINKLKEFGTDLTANFKNNQNTNLFFNLVSYPFSINNTLDSQQTTQFYTFLKFVNENNVTEFLLNPTVTLFDEKETLFTSTDNIPFKEATTKVENNQTVITDSLSYKDVGLVLKIKPSIYSFNNVYLDLDFVVENIISNVDKIPTTSKKTIKQSLNLEVGKTLILTGINKNTKTNNEAGIPLLKDIPYLGNLFKYEYKSNTSTNLTIIFELVPNNKG